MRSGSRSRHSRSVRTVRWPRADQSVVHAVLPRPRTAHARRTSSTPRAEFATAQADIPAIRAALALLLAETGKLDEARGIVSALAADGFARLRDRNWPSSWFQLARAAYLTGDTEVAASLRESGRSFRGECIMVSLATVCLGSAELGTRVARGHVRRRRRGRARVSGSGRDERPYRRPLVARPDPGRSRRPVVRAGSGRRRAPARATRARRGRGHRPPDVQRRAADVARRRPSPRRRNRIDGTRFHRDGPRVGARSSPGASFESRTPRVSPTSPGCWRGRVSRSPRPSSSRVRDPGAPLDDARGDPVLDDRARRELRDPYRRPRSELAKRPAPRTTSNERRAWQRGGTRSSTPPPTHSGSVAEPVGSAIRGERARKAVTARIRNAVDRIGARHPELGAHLRRSIDTGTFCVYRPEHPVDWEM